MSAPVPRNCSRNGCGQPAVATLTYAYADSTAVLGPLSTTAEPHAYDLCAGHTQRLTVPRGWEVVRLPLREQDLSRHDDLLDIADALRPTPPQAPPPPAPDPASGSGPRRPRHASQPGTAARHLRAVDRPDP